MKKILILFGKSDWKKKDIFSDEKYKKAYEDLYLVAEKKNIKLYRASTSWYDIKNKIFKSAWTFENGKWIRVENIKPDLVYDKAKNSIRSYYLKSIIGKTFVVVNNPEFTHFINNKYLASLIFPRYFKKYYKVESEYDLGELKNKILSDRVVLKPISGSGGEGVEILEAGKLDDFKFKKILIAQEFVDSSCGIEDIVCGVHDLRLVFVNDELVYSYIREPAEGSLLANVAMGGTMKIIEEKELPKSVFEIIQEVKDKFSFYSTKIYTIDLIFDENQKPWIIEFNTMPGLYFSKGQEFWRDKMHNALLDRLSDEIENYEKK